MDIEALLNYDTGAVEELLEPVDVEALMRELQPDPEVMAAILRESEASSRALLADLGLLPAGDREPEKT